VGQLYFIETKYDAVFIGDNNLFSNFESFLFTHSFVLVNLHNDSCHVVAT